MAIVPAIPIVTLLLEHQSNSGLQQQDVETVDVLPKHVIPMDSNNNQTSVFWDLLCYGDHMLRSGRCLPEAQTLWFCSRGEMEAVHPEALLPLTRAQRCDHVETCFRGFQKDHRTIIRVKARL